MTLDLSFQTDRGGFRLSIRQSLPATGVTAVFGPSGAGKSTLLRVIAGFDRSGGLVRFAGETWEDGRAFVPPHRRRVGFVFQTPRLFGHLDVRGNLAYAARRAGGMDRMPGVVDQFDLAPLIDRRIGGLSGGEAQRVALARALLAAPRLLLMDEPLAALDVARRAEIFPYIERLRDEAKLPILYVSHSLAEVARLATQTVALAGGAVVGLGPTADVLANAGAAAAFGGEEPGSLILARHQGTDPDGLSRLTFSGGTIFVPALPAAAGEEVRLLIRARDVMIARDRPMGLSALNILAARVRAVEPAGPASADVALICGDAAIRARLTRRSVAELGLAPGADCHAILKSVALARD